MKLGMTRWKWLPLTPQHTSRQADDVTQDVTYVTHVTFQPHLAHEAGDDAVEAAALHTTTYMSRLADDVTQDVTDVTHVTFWGRTWHMKLGMTRWKRLPL
jgi:hypothetical protein